MFSVQIPNASFRITMFFSRFFHCLSKIYVLPSIVFGVPVNLIFDPKNFVYVAELVNWISLSFHYYSTSHFRQPRSTISYDRNFLGDLSFGFQFSIIFLLYALASLFYVGCSFDFEVWGNQSLLQKLNYPLMKLFESTVLVESGLIQNCHCILNIFSCDFQLSLFVIVAKQQVAGFLGELLQCHTTNKVDMKPFASIEPRMVAEPWKVLYR